MVTSSKSGSVETFFECKGNVRNSSSSWSSVLAIARYCSGDTFITNQSNKLKKLLFKEAADKSCRIGGIIALDEVDYPKQNFKQNEMISWPLSVAEVEKRKGST